MKSKTVASIMRHVASKIPAVDAEGQEILQSAEAKEKEQETKGKGTHTARAGRDDGRGWEDDLPQAEERKGV